MWVDEACVGTDVDKSVLLVLLRKTGDRLWFHNEIHGFIHTWLTLSFSDLDLSTNAKNSTIFSGWERERNMSRECYKQFRGNFPTAKKCFKNSGPTNQEILATLHRRNNYCRRERDKSHQVGWRKVRYCSGRVSHGACWVSYHKWCLLQTTTTIVDNKHWQQTTTTTTIDRLIVLITVEGSNQADTKFWRSFSYAFQHIFLI